VQRPGVPPSPPPPLPPPGRATPVPTPPTPAPRKLLLLRLLRLRAAATARACAALMVVGAMGRRCQPCLEPLLVQCCRLVQPAHGCRALLQDQLCILHHRRQHTPRKPLRKRCLPCVGGLLPLGVVPLLCVLPQLLLALIQQLRECRPCRLQQQLLAARCRRRCPAEARPHPQLPRAVILVPRVPAPQN
jgi:hypothetical protein